MTAFSFILGVLPLLVASGAGAEARKVMGMTVFSGMLVATAVGVLIVPALFIFVERYVAKTEDASGADANGDVPSTGSSRPAPGLRAAPFGLQADARLRAARPRGPRSVARARDRASRSPISLVGDLRRRDAHEPDRADPRAEQGPRHRDGPHAGGGLPRHLHPRGQFPFLDVFGSAGRGRSSRKAVPGASTTNNFALGANLSFEIDLWRRFARATEATRATCSRRKPPTGRSRSAWSPASPATTSCSAISTRARRSRSGRRRAAADGAEIVRARFEKGTEARIDVNQAEVQLAIAEASIAQFRRRVAQTEHSLRVLLGNTRGGPRGERFVATWPIVPAGLPSTSSSGARTSSKPSND